MADEQFNSSALGLEKIHANLMEWAKERGVTINGVQPARLPHKGMGVIATRPLKKGEVTVEVPNAAMITADTDFVKKTKGQGLRDGTVHGLLAAALTLQRKAVEKQYAPWEEVWPPMCELAVSMPMVWCKAWQELLPQPAKDYLAKQQAKFDKDWEKSKDLIKGDAFDLFRYYWLVVNTRCFYWEHNEWPPRKPGKRKRNLPAEDNMALAPFVDYFNHASEGCIYTSDAGGCWIICNRDYAAGEEVTFCYGAHNNDYLLVEYGFVLPDNKHDCLILDHIILPELTDPQRELLQEYNYLGNYALHLTTTATTTTLQSSTLCHRTLAALHTLALPSKRATRFLTTADSSPDDRRFVNATATSLLDKYATRIGEAIQELEWWMQDPKRSMLMARWTEVAKLVVECLEEVRRE